MIRKLILISSFTCSLSSVFSQNWTPLFDGYSLAGWEKHGGDARFDVENGMIKGTAVHDSRNTFLCTNQRYGDFILESEILLPNHLNTGIQFRSDIRLSEDRVFGYQCEIDPSMRRFSGGIYDEARRGWLYPLSRNTEAYDAFRLGMWNKIRIECLGSEIRTYINGTLCSRLVDNISSEGIIALQVHGISSTAEEGFQVYWRNLRILTEDVAQYRSTPNPKVEEISFLTNQLTDWERQKGWAFVHLDRKENQEGEYEIVAGQSIASLSRYSEYDLSFEFALTPGTQAGLNYLSVDQQDGRYLSYQLSDDNNLTAEARGAHGEFTVASLGGLIAASNISTKDRPKQYKHSQQWNQARVTVHNGQIDHWLSSEHALSYRLDDQSLHALLLAKWGKSMTQSQRYQTQAFIFLVNSGKMTLRNIKIRQL